MGPIYHFNDIDDEQARALGLPKLPLKWYGSIAKDPGQYTATRLKSGLLNVRIPLKSELMRHSEFGEFIDSVSEGEFSGSYETLPIDLEQEGIRIERAGQWSYDVMSKRVAWSPRTYELYGLSPTVPVVIDDVFKAIHPEDRTRMMHALNDAAFKAREIDEVYKVVVRGEIRRLRCRGKPFDIDSSLMAGRVAGMVCEETQPQRGFSLAGRAAA